jgi:hypothetical protein
VPGTATGVGSLPGADIDEAMRLVLGELPDLPHLPELPARGPGADLIGRAASLLVDMPVETTTTGWQLAERPGRDLARARSLLARDLDALEEHAGGFPGLLKVQVAGPWTLAAALERSRGDRALADLGARRDLVASLTEGVVAHVRDLARRLPSAELVLQLDEPSLPAVLAGRVPSTVGRGSVAALEEHVVVEGLTAVVDESARAGALVLAHCCARAVPIDMFRRSGIRGLVVDAALLTEAQDDEIGTAVEAGLALVLGLLPALGPGAPPPVREVVAPARALWQRLGFPPDDLASVVAVAPACGLAHASEGWVRTALRLSRQAAHVLADAPVDAT